jgi:hypothetical protein
VPTYVFYDKDAVKADAKEKLEEKGARLFPAEADAKGKLNLMQILTELEETGVESILVEGGGHIITSFLRSGLWDYLIIVTAGKIIGDGVDAVGDIGVTSMSRVLKPALKDIRVLGAEVVWTFENGKTNPYITGQTKTRTVVFTAPGEVAVRSETLQGRGALYTSRLMAISPGTERKYFLGHFKTGEISDPEIDCADFTFDYPFPYGYINIIEDSLGGRYFGFLPHTEHFLLENESMLKIDEQMDDETALFIPHMETALSIIHDTKPMVGDRILLTGAGVVGTLTARVLQKVMGIDVTVFDTNPAKGRWFKVSDFISDASKLEKTEPFDRAIEVSGNEEALQLCIAGLLPEGILTVASWYGDRDISINLGSAFHRKRLMMKSSQVSHMPACIGTGWSKSRRMQKAVDLLGQLEVTDLLTHKFSFSSAKEAYTLLVNQDELSGLIALIPGE